MNRRQPALARYAIGALSALAGLGFRAVLGGVLGSTVPYITFFPAVMFAAWYGGLGPGLVATALSLAAAFYFVISPSAEASADIAGAAVFAGVSVFICALTEALAESRREAERGRDFLQTMLSSIGDAAIATDTSGRVTFVNALAAQLTGWSAEAATGKAISEVFVVRDESTAGFADYTTLIAKDGGHIAIEKSIAPIRGEAEQALGEVLVFRDVTERKQAADALLQSEERLQLAIDAGKIGVWDWDIAKDRIDWSERLYAIHGFDRASLPASPREFAKLIHFEDRERILSAIESALAGERPYDVEFRVVHPSGKTAWVSTTASVSRDERGAPLRMLGASTDVTARREAEAQLRQQWRTFDIALSHTPEFIYIVDRNGAFTYANRSLLSFWGKTFEEASGKTMLELGRPADHSESIGRDIQEVIDLKRPLTKKTSIIDPKGELRHYEYQLAPVYAPEGEVEAVTGSTRDVTDLVRAKGEIEESAERYRFLAESIPQMVWTATADGALDYVSGQVAEYFGAEREELIGAGWLAGVHPEDKPRVVERWLHSVVSGEPYETEFRLRRGADGAWRWFLVRAHAQYTDSADVLSWVGTCTDIHGQKESEEALRGMNRELEEFSYVASHDLQEPLRMIGIYSQLILRRVDADDEALAKYGDFVRQGVARMEALIHDLLTFSSTIHMERPAVGSAELQIALSDSIVVLQSAIDECGATIDAGTLPAVRGDTRQMTHVFQNLLSNALKYRRKDLAPAIRITASEAGAEWIISVSDNGIGFDQQYAGRIFGLFRRLHKDEYPGTGLGLAICQRIVERYGGRMWAEGRSGFGATFYFKLMKADE